MKKTLSLLLALVLVFSLAACGNAGNNSEVNSAGSSFLESSEEDVSQAESSNAEDISKSDETPIDSGDPQGNTNLISIGTAASGTFENRYGVKHSVTMCVEEVLRGDEAFSFINDSMMAEKSMWSAEAPEEEDQEYIVAKITYSLLAYDDGGERSASFCYAYSGTFEAYPNLVAAMFYDDDNGYPELSNMEVKVGETVTAYEIFQVSKADSSPVMAYGSNLADYSDGLWFKLY